MKLIPLSSAARKAATSAALAAFAFGTVAHAAEYYLQANMPTNNAGTLHSDNLNLWFDQPSGGGNNPSTFAGHALHSNGFTIRTHDNTNVVGDADTLLELNSRLIIRTGLNTLVTSIATVHSLGGGNARFSAGTERARINIGHLSLTNGDTRFDTDGQTNRAINLLVGTLSGDGNLVLYNGASQAIPGTGTERGLVLTATDATAFTGNITWGDALGTQLTFGNSFVSGGGLVAPSTGRIFLNQDVTFAGVTLSGIELPVGSYSYAYLSTHEQFGSIFLAGGSGSITVAPIPEPASFTALAGGVVLLAATRKKSRRP